MKVTYKYVLIVVLSFLCSIEIMAQSKMEEAKKMIQDGKAECVLIQNDSIWSGTRTWCESTIGDV